MSLACGRLIDSYAQGLLEKGEFEPRVGDSKSVWRGLKHKQNSFRKSLPGDRSAADHRSPGRLRRHHDRYAGSPGLWEAQCGTIRTLVKPVEIEQGQVNVVFRVLNVPSSFPGPLSSTRPTASEVCGRSNGMSS